MSRGSNKRTTTRLYLAFASSALVAVVLGAGVAATAQETGGRPLAAMMSGAQEAPVPGDPDGSGHAMLTLNQGQGQICYTLHVSNIAPASAAHIHVAPAGMPGPVVVPLAAPTGGMSQGCATVDPELIKRIRQNPGAYYVNVHNSDYPGGAVRGQLSK